MLVASHVTCGVERAYRRSQWCGFVIASRVNITYSFGIQVIPSLRIPWISLLHHMSNDREVSKADGIPLSDGLVNWVSTYRMVFTVDLCSLLVFQP